MPVFAKMAISALVFMAVYSFSFWILFAEIFPENLSWLEIMTALRTTTDARRAAVVGAAGLRGGFSDS